MSEIFSTMRNHWTLLLVYLFTFFTAAHGNCTKPDPLAYGQLSDEFIDKVDFPVNTTVTYVCVPGYISVPGISKNRTCLSNSTWSTPEVFCTRRSCPSLPDVQNGDFKADDGFLFGSTVTYTCNIGYRLESKIDTIICLANGDWSHIPPTCAVQECPPPPAITDGKYDPTLLDYVYLNSVTYSCNSGLSLIGSSSIYCTAHGNWSSDPPLCKAVDCADPHVQNSVRLSGFTGPYTLHSAITFECIKGYTMVGYSLITCNASSLWDPSPPTCKTIVTEKPTTEKVKPTENTGSTTTTPKPATTKKTDADSGAGIVTQKPTTEKVKPTDGTGAGGHVGAIVGGVIAGIVAVTAVAVFIWWCKIKSGKPYSDPHSVTYGTCAK
ncbi:complement decay-accelerating factor-like isoform X4 [Pseudophryne corroboree]|uniref:complement decay-accelerating factor-like isoform X4 n=1 Tax=Pseudophryne corroboree TaxID=495146 RepID=UPI003081DC3A